MNTIFTAMKPQQVRQGDVLVTPALRKIDQADVGHLVKEGDGKRIVLAYGEVTGHAHAFYPHKDLAEQVEEVEPVEAPVKLYELNNAAHYSGSSIPGQRLLRLATRALLRHEEHDTISLPAGDYVVINQFEGDEVEELRRVAD